MDEENKASESANDSSGNSKKMNPMIIVGVVLVVAVIGYFVMTMMGDKTQDSLEVVDVTKNNDSMEATGVTGSSDKATGDVVNVTLEGGNFYFKPNVINAKLGQTVRVTLNSVSMQHDFVIDELGVKTSVLPSGKSETIEFVADTIGEFEFYCSVGNHKQQGMIGTLVVTQ